MSVAPIIVSIRHRDPLLALGVLATLREDSRFAPHSEHLPSYVPPGSAEIADVVVADYESGLELANRSTREGLVQRVLIVTDRNGEVDVQQAMTHGVLGYVPTGCHLEEIIDGVLALHSGRRYIAQSAALRLVEGVLHQALTNREVEVLQYVVAGWSNKMVANHLGLSLGTVKCHVRAILDKLDAKSRTQAAMVARQRGLVTTDGRSFAYSSKSAAASSPIRAN